MAHAGRTHGALESFQKSRPRLTYGARACAVVEDNSVMEAKLLNRLGIAHILAADSPEQLAQWVGGDPVLNRVGLNFKDVQGLQKPAWLLALKSHGSKRRQQRRSESLCIACSTPSCAYRAK